MSTDRMGVDGMDTDRVAARPTGADGMSTDRAGADGAGAERADTASTSVSRMSTDGMSVDGAGADGAITERTSASRVGTHRTAAHGTATHRTGPLRMAAVSAEFGRDLEEDFAVVERLIKEARAEGVGLLALPEACLGGYLLSLDDSASDEGPPALALDGPEIRRLASLAGDLTVIAGYCEADGDARYNSVVCVNGDGVLGNHRKVHQPLSEDVSYASGDRFHAFDTPVGRIGMMICYDKAFPESARALALDGAEIGVCVSAWPGARTHATTDLVNDRWKRRFDLFDRARALENQIVWISANQAGTFGSLRFVGSAKVVDPGGEILADTGVGSGLAIAELDVTQALETARRSMGHLRDRRPETYTHAGAVSP